MVSANAKLDARALKQDHDAMFLQCVGLPAPVVRAIHDAEITREAWHYAQWRLDIPHDLGPHPVTDAIRNTLEVAEGILHRGTTPFCSPETEAFLEERYPGATREIAQLPKADLAALLREATRKSDFLAASSYFDGVDPQRDGDVSQLAEYRFQKIVRQKIYRERLPWRLIPQIALRSLASRFQADRGDFLLVNSDDPTRMLLVELDGPEHLNPQQAATDRLRDLELDRANPPVATLRIRNDEVWAFFTREPESTWPNLAKLRTILIKRSSPAGERLHPEHVRLLVDAKRIHQLVVTLIVAARTGYRKVIDVNSLERYDTIDSNLVLRLKNHDDDPSRAHELAEFARSQFRRLVRAIVQLHGLRDLEIGPEDAPDAWRVAASAVSIAPEGTAGSAATVGDQLFISIPSDGPDQRHPAEFIVSDVVFPARVPAPRPTKPERIRVESPDLAAAEWLLHYLFRHEKFADGQWEAIRRTLEGRDSVVLLPTGAGKSVVFQFSALVLAGRALVICPIRALMNDQVFQLEHMGIDRCEAIHSGHANSRDQDAQAINNVASGHSILTYIAPERLQIQSFRDAVAGLRLLGLQHGRMPISIVAVDEAHCVSEWGHDFRPAYLNLGRVVRDICTYDGGTPPIVALTGTASSSVLKDMVRDLGITDQSAVISPKTLDRPNLRFRVVDAAPGQNAEAVIDCLAATADRLGVRSQDLLRPGRHGGRPSTIGLVFAPHVGGDHGTRNLQAKFEGESPSNRVASYDGSAENAPNLPSTMRDFRNGRVALLVCTKAFGMGVNIPNIRYTVHYGLPSSIEAFYQEAGRAGRDGAQAFCSLIRSIRGPNEQRPISNPVYRSYREQDDVDRAFYFVREAFQTERDLEAVWEVLHQTRGLGSDSEGIVSVTQWLVDEHVARNTRSRLNRRGQIDRFQAASDVAKNLEKAIYRLVIMGLVSDYTRTFGSNPQFHLRVTGATPDDVAQAVGSYIGAFNSGVSHRFVSDIKNLAAVTPARSHFIYSVAGLLLKFAEDHVRRARVNALYELVDATRAEGTDTTPEERGEQLRVRMLAYLEQSEFSPLIDTMLTTFGSDGSEGVADLARIMEVVESAAQLALLRGTVGRLLTDPLYARHGGLLLLRAWCDAASPRSNLAGIRRSVDEFLEAESAMSFQTIQIISIALEYSTRFSGQGTALLDAILGRWTANRVHGRRAILALYSLLFGTTPSAVSSGDVMNTKEAYRSQIRFALLLLLERPLYQFIKEHEGIGAAR